MIKRFKINVMKTLTLLLTAFLLFTQFSCMQDKGYVPSGTIKSEVIEADNAFGMDIFKMIYDVEEEANFMISPLSISMALTMAYNGADSKTREEMEEALRIAGINRDEINITYQELIATLTSIDPKVVMEIANSIWHDQGYSVEQDFLDINSNFFDEEVRKADFKDAETVDLINNWVSDKTHEKIPTIINEIPAMAVMYIINAIYFNGSWTQEFNPENTRNEAFTLSNGEYITTDMMQRTDTVSYLSNGVFSAIELPYGDGKFNMMLMLPNPNQTTDDVVELFGAKNWKNWQKDFTLTNDVDILLPKFKIEYMKTLKSILSGMGMQEAFSTNADFSGINPNRDLFISEVLHKTFIQVDEEGTEAAAVTAIVFETTSFDPNKPQKTYFHCNRPFLFAISEKDTGAILFMGKVGSPEFE